MKMKSAFVVVLCFSFASIANAESDSASVAKKPDGKLEIKSTVIAPNGCYSKGSETFGAPSGERKIENAIPVTFALKHSGASICTQGLVKVPFTIVVEGSKDAQAIIVYVSDPNTKSITARALALPK